MNWRTDAWQNGFFRKRDDHLVHTTPNHHPPKMDVLPKTVLQIILAARTFGYSSVCFFIYVWLSPHLPAVNSVPETAYLQRRLLSPCYRCTVFVPASNWKVEERIPTKTSIVSLLRRCTLFRRLFEKLKSAYLQRRALSPSWRRCTLLRRLFEKLKSAYLQRRALSPSNRQCTVLCSNDYLKS